MPTCLDLVWHSGLEGVALQIQLDQCHPHFSCEFEVCSPHSPGPVNDAEEVAFLLINPLHFDKQRGVIVPAAFQELTNRDLSVLRLTYATKHDAEATKDDLVARGADRIPPQMRLVDEVCIATVSDLRADVAPHGRLIGVFDTALDGKSSHASLFTNEVVLSDARLRKVVRQRVHYVMTRRRERYDDVYEGLP